eukprot:m.302341 g.302341  ORF g.302341 m.302341 type:complete len:363 (+) comp15130_c0_seq1:213-1301(+)
MADQLVDDELRLLLRNRGLTDLACLAKKTLPAEDILEIDVSQNRIKTLPPALARCASLERLHADHNALMALPDLSPLGCLTHLHLSRNHLTALHPSVFELELVELHVQNNMLTELPPIPRDNTTLRTLDVSNNRLLALPDSLCRLRRLAILSASRNALARLPEGLGELGTLVSLDVSANQIDELPRSLCRLDHLEDLLVGENPLMWPPAELCARGRIHIFNFLAKQEPLTPRRSGAHVQQDAAAGGDRDNTSAGDSGAIDGLLGMMTDVVTSIYTPGVNKGLHQFVGGIYAILILLAFALMFAFGANIHVVILTILSIGLAASLHWFIVESAKLQEEQKRLKELNAQNGASDAPEETSKKAQ